MGREGREGRSEAGDLLPVTLSSEESSSCALASMERFMDLRRASLTACGAGALTAVKKPLRSSDVAILHPLTYLSFACTRAGPRGADEEARHAGG
jgi:hypothetical protein